MSGLGVKVDFQQIRLMSNDEYLKDRVRIISQAVLSAYGRFGRFRNNGVTGTMQAVYLW